MNYVAFMPHTRIAIYSVELRKFCWNALARCLCTIGGSEAARFRRRFKALKAGDYLPSFAMLLVSREIFRLALFL
jgi:hypothetical protein